MTEALQAITARYLTSDEYDRIGWLLRCADNDHRVVADLLRVSLPVFRRLLWGRSRARTIAHVRRRLEALGSERRCA